MPTPEKHTMVTYRQRLNVERMRSSHLDALIVFFKLLVAVIGLATLIRCLTGCGGAPFESIVSEPVVVDAGVDAEPDVDSGSIIVVDSGAVDSGVKETSPPVEAGPPPEGGPVDTGPTSDGGPACCEHPTAACSYSLGSCPIPSENHGSFPTSFEVYTTPAEFCATMPTPSTCLCDYSCACVTSHWSCPSGSISCTNDPVQGILITCAN